MINVISEVITIGTSRGSISIFLGRQVIQHVEARTIIIPEEPIIDKDSVGMLYTLLDLKSRADMETQTMHQLLVLELSL